MALRRCTILLALVAGLLCGGIAHADHQPAIAVPGKRGVPVIINGRDATWAMVIGDWGLYRPGHVTAEVVPLWWWRPAPRVRRSYTRPHRYSPPRVRRTVVRHRHYFPGGSVKPEPKAFDDEPPQPAESYSREWHSRSAPLPAVTESATTLIIDPADNLRRPSARRRAGIPRADADK